MTFIVNIINETCPKKVPEELHDIWGNPATFLLMACFTVWASSSLPLVQEFFQAVKKIIVAMIDRIAAAATKQTPTPPSPEVELSGVGVGDMEEGASTFNPVLVEAQEAAKKKATQQIDSAKADVLEALGPEQKAKAKEPDKANATYDVLLQLFCALLAFWDYWSSPNVNYMDITLWSDHSVECKAVWFTSIVMYKPATLSLWLVLMATTHLAYWRRVKSIPLKEQTNIDPGERSGD
jgi:hypothetical protein